MVNVALCCDEAYSVPALVTIISIFENGKDTQYSIFVLTDFLKEKTRAKFEKISKIYNQTIEIITVGENHYSQLKIIDRFPKQMYYRFLLPELLSGIGKIIYLDCDILVRDSLNELFNIDINGKAAAVVIDQNCDDIRIYNRLGEAIEYFNSGVILMNLDFWRENKINAKLINFIEKNPEKCLYPDQDALNIILKHDVKFIDTKFNFQALWLDSVEDAIVDRSRWDEIKSGKNHPLIIHFSWNIKPWHYECVFDYTVEYRNLANKYHFIGFKLYRKIPDRIDFWCNKIKRLITINHN